MKNNKDTGRPTAKPDFKSDKHDAGDEVKSDDDIEDEVKWDFVIRSQHYQCHLIRVELIACICPL